MEQKPINREATLLIVDDDDIDAMGIERALRKHNRQNPVVRARNGIEGLELLRSPDAIQRPYIVLLDINMPLMSGLEMLREMRKDRTISNAVVFILTTSKIDHDQVEAYANHAAGYIVKSQIGDGFTRIIEMLDCYWRVVELPSKA